MELALEISNQTELLTSAMNDELKKLMNIPQENFVFPLEKAERNKFIENHYKKPKVCPIDPAELEMCESCQ